MKWLGDDPEQRDPPKCEHQDFTHGTSVVLVNDLNHKNMELVWSVRRELRIETKRDSTIWMCEWVEG